ncbi:hypothetical protein EYF80_051211 [Liparis tanakae]|uniref:Uncharacterized protein n=1 Tax=Liparis tanakae TaxID=230148 RepID=A0A4Z2FBR2_9TELE|nr:hypothetical protein EYF80_051211 [Liparis tanakae]
MEIPYLSSSSSFSSSSSPPVATNTSTQCLLPNTKHPPYLVVSVLMGRTLSARDSNTTFCRRHPREAGAGRQRCDTERLIVRNGCIKHAELLSQPITC